MTQSSPNRLGRSVLRGLGESLQEVVDSVSDLAAFEVAAIAVLHPDQQFEYLAISSANASAQAMLGRGTTLAAVRAEHPHAEHWGRFDYVPHGAPGFGLSHTWTPDGSYPAAADAWHPEDILGTLLRDRTGAIIGMLSLDIPLDGRKPGQQQLELMEAFAAHADRVVARGLDRGEISERLHLANTARTIVRSASSFHTLREVLQECRPALVDGFGLMGLWIQMFSDKGDSVPLVTTASGTSIEAPEYLLKIAERAARAAWEQQTVTVVAPHQPAELISSEEQTAIVDYLATLGVGSMLFVPIGSQTHCLGNLVLTREGPGWEWSDAERTTALEIGRDLGQALFNAQLFARNHDLVEELQELNNSKRTFVDMMVHELKNPLNAISGYVELAQDVPDLPEDVRISLAGIERGAGRLLDLVVNLLTVSKINEQNPTLQQVDLMKLVAANIDMLRHQAAASEISVSADGPDEAWLTADIELLDLVCSNLISNAIKYTPAGGRVRIVVETGEDDVTLRVIDNGLGISSEDQLHLFDDFFRSTNPEAIKLPGTGLGLASVARIVDQHQGTISVQSRLGEGSEFCVRLPQLR